MKQFKILTKKRPEKGLLIGLRKKGGRTFSGRISVHHQGGGAKRLYRIIDFAQSRMGVPAVVVSIEYDPNRTSFICLLEYPDGQKLYRICAHGLKAGDQVICDEKADLKIGNRMRLKNVPIGTQVFEVELEPGRGAKLARSAGSSIKVLAHEGKYTQIVLGSSEVRKVPSECFGTIGQASFPEHKYISIGKAGRARHMGRRPTVRGSAMNPVDHPHGGGEGRTSIGMKYPKTPWGKPALGVKTRRDRWTDKLIVERRKKKKK